MERRAPAILVVEDDAPVRDMLADFFCAEGYDVATAEDGRDAWVRLLPDRPFDLVLSDINMPHMKGFELLNAVRWRYPGVRRMLMTAYNVEDYLNLAMKYDVGNIFVKSTPFAFDELRTTVRNLLTGDIFGLERYFAPGTPVKRTTIRTSDELTAGAATVMGMLPKEAHNRKLEVAIGEILVNAVFYGARGELSGTRHTWGTSFVLGDEQAVMVTVMADAEKYGVAIVDNAGRLTKQDVLYWLNRQATQDDRGLPLGAFDTHGRGLFIARRFIDRLIINIERGRTTEIIIINYAGRALEDNKPLYINEL